MIVVDTCIIAHLFNKTEQTAVAQRVLKKDSSWIVPLLWQEEYANVLSKLARQTSRNFHDVLTHFEYVLKEMNNCEMSVSIQKALEVSLEHKISVYDAHFVVLAMHFDVPLITEDKEILQKCAHIAMNMCDFIDGQHDLERHTIPT